MLAVAHASIYTPTRSFILKLPHTHTELVAYSAAYTRILVCGQSVYIELCVVVIFHVCVRACECECARERTYIEIASAGAG